MGKEHIGSGSIPESEKNGAKILLAMVFENNSSEELLIRALNEFDDVYGEDIPGWMQFLYDYLGSFEGNGTKMKVVRNYAEKHQIEIKDVQE